jgi:hypothetical protein
MAESAESREAAHGSRMIEIKIRFWTNDLAPKGKVVPKEGWTSGVVRITPNKAHGIEPGAAVPFNSLMELPAKIEKVLIDNGITLHLTGKGEKYLVSG